MIKREEEFTCKHVRVFFETRLLKKVEANHLFHLPYLMGV